ncbi:unnamed protein product [Miscanthus lutarioriparius]|uniref:GT-1/4-like C-terminal domain-containing protein n=1 Tax=Miscanthus lutarioriparius TaxID=422564 RepID=A0A811QW69_9POAL|nr:unnamed protein product [Miscanthus lutarioriparius]
MALARAPCWALGAPDRAVAPVGGPSGFEDANIPFGPVEANGRPMLSIDDRLEDDRHPLPLTAADAVATNGVNPWNWRDTSTNGGDNHGSFGGRVILVKWGDYTKRIGIDGTPEAIKEAIKSAFGLRTRRAFWLEDEDEVVRALDRDMPVGTYTLNLDDGMTIKLCDGNRMQTPEDKGRGCGRLVIDFCIIYLGKASCRSGIASTAI